jgi:hypothetical protein
MITEEPRMEIPLRKGLKSLRLGQSTISSKLVWEYLGIKEPQLTGCTSKESLEIAAIGTILPRRQLRPASALKLGRINPAPDKTKRITVLK